MRNAHKIMITAVMAFILSILGFSGFVEATNNHEEKAICHAKGNGDFVYIEPDNSSSHMDREGGLKHGDVLPIDGKCPTPQPETPKPLVSDWVDGTYICGDATVTQTQTTTTYGWTQVGYTWTQTEATTTATQTRDLTSDERQSVCEHPENVITYSEWVDGNVECGDTTVLQTRKQFTEVYTWNGTEYVIEPDSAVQSGEETQVRDLTEEELAELETLCTSPPTEPPNTQPPVTTEPPVVFPPESEPQIPPVFSYPETPPTATLPTREECQAIYGTCEDPDTYVRVTPEPVGTEFVPPVAEVTGTLPTTGSTTSAFLRIATVVVLLGLAAFIGTRRNLNIRRLWRND